MKKWKYKNITEDWMLSEAELNKFGETGWELCSNFVIKNVFIYVLKKQIK